MYIRRVTTRRSASGEAYFSYRLVETRRAGTRVRQVALLNLGRHFDLAEEHWPALCARIQALLSPQGALMPVELPAAVETQAQAIAARLLARTPVKAHKKSEFAEVDVNSLELMQPRSVGVEHVGLHALSELGLDALLASLGVNGITRAMIFAQIIGRMAAPGSERATWGWLDETSALPELLDLSLPDLSIMRLYRASDALLKHQAAIEAHLFGRVRDLFGLDVTVTLYDLTNTYFEGTAAGIPKAQRGHSKEKRSDCPLLTLGLVLDASGFVQRSRVLAGNAVEYRTLEAMLKDLGVPAGAMIVMDRGIATEENLAWLREKGYRYLVVSRERARCMPQGESTLTTAGGETVRVEKVVDEAAGEVRLYCHSSAREAKERAIDARLCARFETGLKRLAEGLTRPRGEKRAQRIHERIGRLKAACQGVAQHYAITVETDANNSRVLKLTWEKNPVADSRLATPGVYCLRSNETTWSEEQLWRTYRMLTDLEAVFRSLKSELGLRPVYHLKPERADGHLFISVGPPVRAVHSPAAEGEGHRAELVILTRDLVGATTGHSALSAKGWPHPARAQSHPARAQAQGDLCGPRSRPPARRDEENGRLINTSPLDARCSDTRAA